MKRNNIHKILVVFTSGIALSLMTIVIILDVAFPKKIDLDNQLNFGNSSAPIKIVVFEDFRCKYCKILSQEVLPKIKEKYIDTNIASYHIIPLAFICGSKKLANAALCVYDLNKDKFFEYLNLVYAQDDIETKEELKQIAKDFIDTDMFDQILDEKKMDLYLENNLKMAKKIMRKGFMVPTFYINGIKVPEDKIDQTIKMLLSKDNQ